MYYQGGSAIQATDELHTLYLVNPSNLHQPHTNISFLNSASASTTGRGLDSQAPLPQAQQFVCIPISQDPNRTSSIPGQQDEVHAPHGYQAIIPSFDYNLWRSVDDRDPNTSLPTPKCLSLSLSSDETGLNKLLLNDHHVFIQSSNGMTLPRVSRGVESKRGRVMRSKYLKAAQQLLDEVANVGEGIDTNRSVGSTDKANIMKASINGGKDGGAEKPTTAERPEIQMKKAKLVGMLDEVEQRYSHYQHQMHMLVALFEQTGGIGSSRRYTQLASRMISKQFRCLKDAISSQINVSKNCLSDEHENEDEKFERSRLEFSVHRFMRQRSAWRTQRGLPERAVSVLRAWLFEHFLHPYPKDLDKNMMVKQTGLTKSQVSNWFINARVRLWKPMVEEMYLEEMKNQQQIHSEKTTTKSTRTNKGLGRRQKVVALNDTQGNSKGFSMSAEKTSSSSHEYFNRHLRFSTEQRATGFHRNSVFLTLALPPSHWSPGLSQHQHNLQSNSTFEFGKRILVESGSMVNGVQDSDIGYEILDFHKRNPFHAPVLPDFRA